MRCPLSGQIWEKYQTSAARIYLLGHVAHAVEILYAQHFILQPI